MKRNVSLEEISDGRLYSRNDMVRADCGGCKGCSDCCHGMGESVILDPYDAWRLSGGLGVPFAALLEQKLELHVVDGIILPNLKMDPKTDACGFLNEQGRCSIHAFRPGVCRLFPLGRYYSEAEEKKEFRYFLQVHECPMPNKTKVKVSKWLGIPNLKKYEAFIGKWLGLLEEVRDLTEKAKDEQLTKELTVYLLNTCYLTVYKENVDFYDQFEERYHRMKKLLQVLKQKKES